MPDEIVKITLRIPKYHYRWLKIWGYLKGKEGVAPMGSDVIQARVEANLKQINTMLESRAKDQGLTVEQLIDKIEKDKQNKADK